MKPRALQAPLERLVEDLFLGFYEVTVMLPDGTKKRIKPSKVAAHIEAGDLISPLDIGVELSWLILEVSDRADARAIVAFMLKRRFEAPIRVRNGTSTTLIWRISYGYGDVRNGADIIRRGLAEMWPSVNPIAPQFVQLADFVDDAKAGRVQYATAFMDIEAEMRDRLDGWIDKNELLSKKQLPDGRLAIRFGRRERFYP